MVIEMPGGRISSASVLVAVRPSRSVAVSASCTVPAADGVPTMWPPVTDRPAGALDADHVYGARPPKAASAWSYATPAMPCGSDAVEIATGSTSAIGSGIDAVAVRPSASVTVTASGAVLAAVGVPARVPEASSVSPAGSADAAHAYGARPPVAVSVCE